MLSCDRSTRALTFQEIREDSGSVKIPTTCPGAKEDPALEYHSLPVRGRGTIGATSLPHVGEPIAESYLIRAVLEHAED